MRRFRAILAKKQGINQIYKKIISSEVSREIKDSPLKNVLFGTFATEQDIPVVIYVLGSEPYMPHLIRLQVPDACQLFNINCFLVFLLISGSGL